MATITVQIATGNIDVKSNSWSNSIWSDSWKGHISMSASWAAFHLSFWARTRSWAWRKSYCQFY
jgi:hypothetical protein